MKHSSAHRTLEADQKNALRMKDRSQDHLLKHPKDNNNILLGSESGKLYKIEIKESLYIEELSSKHRKEITCMYVFNNILLFI